MKRSSFGSRFNLTQEELTSDTNSILLIEDAVKECDVAYLDGTFFGNGEIPGRDMSLIPHPFIEESLQRFAKLPADVRARIRFIHLNHTNPVLNPDSAATRLVNNSGCHVADQGEQQA